MTAMLKFGADPNLKGKDIHEIKPVKFGGSPTEPGNKMSVSKTLHQELTKWWNDLQRYIETHTQGPR